MLIICQAVCLRPTNLDVALPDLRDSELLTFVGVQWCAEVVTIFVFVRVFVTGRWCANWVLSISITLNCLSVKWPQLQTSSFYTGVRSSIWAACWRPGSASLPRWVLHACQCFSNRVKYFSCLWLWGVDFKECCMQSFSGIKPVSELSNASK